jgi:hypothetical protein
VPTCQGPCTDFPPDPQAPDPTQPQKALVPVAMGGFTSNPTQIFNPTGNNSGGPCLLEPQVSEASTGKAGALFPFNWLRPRFRVTAPSGQDIFEFRIHADNQANDLLVYTTNKFWTMPKEMWQNLAGHSQDMPITVTVRGASQSGGQPSLGSKGDFTIAPATAEGKLVYWSTSGSTHGTPTNDQTLLSGFAVGDEGVVTVLTPGQATDVAKGPDGKALPAASHCIGCHTSTPDGAFISYNDFYPWDLVLASAVSTPVGAAPTWLTPTGYLIMSGLNSTGTQTGWLGISTYSPAHWAESNGGTPNEHLAVVSWGAMEHDPMSQLAWIDLAATSSAKGLGWGILTRTGDSRGAAAPAWSRTDGSFVIYTSTTDEISGRLGTGLADLYSVDWGNRAGGAATPLPGASDPAFAEYYPSLTFDDTMVAFNRIPQSVASATHPPIGNLSGVTAWDGMYAQPQTEVWVTARTTNNPTRLAANDPPTCMNVSSPGINNTWAKWSPKPSFDPGNGNRYYWLIFSSWRDGLLNADNQTPIAQLYIAGVVVNETSVQTYPAIYLWNQPTTISNHTPAWDNFQIPLVVQ